MYDLATCRASVLRGTTTDAYGDEVDGQTVIASGIPASITEHATTAYDPATDTPRTVRAVSGTFPSGTDVTPDDRVRDDTHELLYAVEAVTQNRTPGRTSDLTLQLKHIN